MIKKNNKERVIEEINENKIENIFNIIPNISDKVVDYNEEKFKITSMIDNTFNDKRKYNSDITPSLFILSGVQSRMKQQFSISELPLALTSEKVIDTLEYNISYKPEEGLLKESNKETLQKEYSSLFQKLKIIILLIILINLIKNI